jgi:hypothetical protein
LFIGIVIRAKAKGRDDSQQVQWDKSRTGSRKLLIISPHFVNVEDGRFLVRLSGLQNGESSNYLGVLIQNEHRQKMMLAMDQK